MLLIIIINSNVEIKLCDVCLDGIFFCFPSEQSVVFTKFLD